MEKPNGKVRLCLDPRNLNKAIQREHYPMKTVEEVAAELSDAKVFSVLDATSGFWHIKLDEKSSELLTFNSAFFPGLHSHNHPGEFGVLASTQIQSRVKQVQ